MAVRYLPARDAALQTWAVAFSAQITATPTAFGLVAGQATTLAGYVTVYTNALAAATNEATRTKATVAAKNVAKNNLTANIFLLVGIIQTFPTITDSQLAGLGLTVRSTTRTPVPAPETTPLVAVLGITSRFARLVIADELTPASRARPANVVGMNFWYKVGGVAPTSTESMVFGGLLTRTPISYELPVNSIGETVYFIGKWVTGRGLEGPQSPIAQATAG